MRTAFLRATAVLCLLLCLAGSSGEYELTDKAYATLLQKLSKRNFDLLTPQLRVNILQFYGDLSADIATRKKADDWKELVSNLEKLESVQTTQNARRPSK